MKALTSFAVVILFAVTILTSFLIATNVLADRNYANYDVLTVPTNNSNRSNTYFDINVSSVVDNSINLQNMTIEFKNYSATNYTVRCLNYTDGSAKTYCLAKLNASDTEHNGYFNFTIYINTTNATAALNKSSLYQFRVDNNTPVIGSQVLNQTFTNTSLNVYPDRMYESGMFVKFNVSDTSLDNQPCWLEVWVQNVSTGGVRTWTLNSTTKFFGTYTAASSLRNCTVTVNGTDIKNVLFGTGHTNDYGVVRLQAMANDSLGRNASGINFTVVMNNLKSGWNPVGWLGNANTLGGIRGLVNNNASYISVRNNFFGNASWVTWTYPVNSNNASAINNHNLSGLYLYMDNDWIWIRANTTVTAIDDVSYPVQVKGINLTWFGATAAGWHMSFAAGNLQCINNNLTFPVNTSATFTPYINFTTAMVNAQTDANSSWGDPSYFMTGGSNFTYNSTCFNLTNSSGYAKLTNIIYSTNDTRSSWSMFTVKNTNTTNYTAQELNASSIAWQNISDTRCTGGCFVSFDKDIPYINNDTVLFQGQAIWVLPDASVFNRYSTIRIISYGSPGLNTTNINRVDIGENKIVKLWSRAASLD